MRRQIAKSAQRAAQKIGRSGNPAELIAAASSPALTRRRRCSLSRWVITADRTRNSRSLPWPRFRRHHPVVPVIHYELPVVLARMLDDAVGQVVQAIQMRSAVVHRFV